MLQGSVQQPSYIPHLLSRSLAQLLRTCGVLQAPVHRQYQPPTAYKSTPGLSYDRHQFHRLFATASTRPPVLFLAARIDTGINPRHH